MSLINTANGQPWMDYANCRTGDPDLHFPNAGQDGARSSAAINQTMRAKTVCRECVVRTECLEYALESDQRYGIWGALDEGQRAAMKRKGYRQTFNEKQEKMKKSGEN